MTVPTFLRLDARRLVLAALLLGLALGYPAARVLPVSAGWENGVLENLQVALLLAGALLAWRFARRRRRGAGGPATAALGRAAVPLWLVLAARELSWGAVLGTPLRVASWGRVYSSSTLWYKPAVYPAVALLLAYSVFVLWRWRVLPQLWARARRACLPWLELALLAAALLLSTYAEGHLPGLPAPAGLGEHALVMEEWMELVAYAALLAVQGRVLRSMEPELAES